MISFLIFLGIIAGTVFGGTYIALVAVVCILLGPYDKHAGRTLIIAGSIIWTTGTLLCGLAPGFWFLFAARILVGIGEAALAPAAASIISDSFPPHQRGTALGIFMMGMVVGGPGAVGVGGFLLASAQHGDLAHWSLFAGLADWRIVLVMVGAAVRGRSGPGAG